MKTSVKDLDAGELFVSTDRPIIGVDSAMFSKEQVDIPGVFGVGGRSEEQILDSSNKVPARYNWADKRSAKLTAKLIIGACS